jgi:drug/metabolite transporter (DMT)-like permease
VADQPALSATEPDLAVLGRQHRAGAPCRRPCAAADAVLRALDRHLPDPAAVRLAAPEAGLAGAARASPHDVVSFVGFAYNNAISYWALQYTEALNALLIQSAGPLFVALWSLALFGVRLTGAQLAGITISLLGVLTIILRGDFGALASISFNRGDLMFASSLVSFGLYSALIPRRPVTHALSLISFTTCCGALMLLPFSIWEYSTGATLKFDLISMATLGYAVIFPSTLAYLFFNRGLALIGHNRAAPFFHLVPVFGSAMAILLLGEQLRLFHGVGYALVLAGVVIASRRASAGKA